MPAKKTLEVLSEAVSKDISASRKRLDKLDCLQAGWRDMQHLLTTFGVKSSDDPVLNDRLSALEGFLQDQKNSVARETNLRLARIEAADAFLRKIAEAASLYKAQALEETNRNPGQAGSDPETIVAVSREVVSANQDSLNIAYYRDGDARQPRAM